MKTEIKNKCYIEIDPIYKKTGEIKHVGMPIEVAEQEMKVPRGNFEIAYVGALCDIIDRLGGKKYVVFKYIIKNKYIMNCLNMSNSELAEKCGVSRKTVVETMKILMDAGVVIRKGTVIRLSSKVLVKGDKQREAYIMRKFIEEKALNDSKRKHPELDGDVMGGLEK